MFNPHTASAPLLLSMLAISACLCPPQTDGIDGEKLYAMAESALHHCRNESRIDIIQALMILSLRQTGVGDKRSAFTYAGRAATMALNLGLHLAPTTHSEAGECELRSRVYWNVYVLDKILAEELGRPLCLRYRRSSTPLPSETESDEFEPWPPQSPSSAPIPASVRHITPRRGHIMSFFVWTCRMGMIMEDILDLEVIGPPVYDSWDRRFISRIEADQDVWRRAERIAGDLDAWRESMPAKLEVSLDPAISPLPHHVVGLSWYHTGRILLYCRFLRRKHGAGRGGPPALAEKAHRICSESAEACIDMLAHLDRHKLLSQCSSDCVHMMSVITLWEAFDASSSDPAIAHRAKLNFAQCCIWLRDFSSSWPAASAHKLFFEGLIQGGLKLSSGDLFKEGETPESEPRPDNGVQITEGLRSMGRNLADDDDDEDDRYGDGTPQAQRLGHELGQPISHGSRLALDQLGQQQQPNLFNLPQFYWNHLTTGEPQTGMAEQQQQWDFDAMNGAQPPGMFEQSAPDGVQQQQQQLGAQDRPAPTPPVQMQSSSFDIPPWANNAAGAGNAGNAGAGTGEGTDQAAIYAALMSYMVEAARSR